jgi:hypothetical protein
VNSIAVFDQMPDVEPHVTEVETRTFAGDALAQRLARLGQRLQQHEFGLVPAALRQRRVQRQ